MRLVLRAAAPAERLDLRLVELRTDLNGSRVRLVPATGKSIDFALGDRALRRGVALSSGLSSLNQRRVGACTLAEPDAQAPGSAQVVAKGQDPRGRPQQCWSATLPAPVMAMTVSGDQRLVVVALGDGSVRWLAAGTGQPLLAVALEAGRKRWVAWTPMGYYDASPDGADRLGWELPRTGDEAPDFFPVRLFSERLRRPDLISRVLFVHDEQRALVEVNAEAGLRESAVPLLKQVPPVLRVLTPQPGSVVRERRLLVRYSLRSPSGLPVREWRLLVRGKDAQYRGAAERRLVKAGATPEDESIYEEAVEVPAEDAVLDLRAETAQGTADPLQVPLRWEGAVAADPQARPDLYVLAVGVGGYRDPALRLDFPAKDARDVEATLRTQEGRRYRRVETRVLTDGEATGAAVLAGLRWLRTRATPGDVVAVFLAGHGVTEANRGTYAFYPYDADIGRPESWLGGEALRKELGRTPGRVLLFIDTCHSGKVDLSRLVDDLSSNQSGVVVYAASTGAQQSIEASRWNNGAFTKALVEGLQGRADYQGIGRVSVSELEHYISERVRELTNERQVPTSAKPGSVPDFLLATVRPRLRLERKWWFWSAAGAVTAGIVAGAVLGTRPGLPRATFQ